MAERVFAPGEHTDDEEAWVSNDWFTQHEAWVKSQEGKMRIPETTFSDQSPTEMRTFATGATRNQDTEKPDYEGYISPLVTKRFGEYMTLHRKQADGKLRDSDNWQKGIPLSAYIKSQYRHFQDLLLHHRGLAHLASDPDITSVLCAIRFNNDGYLHETLKARLGEKTLSTGAPLMTGEPLEDK